MSSLRRRSLALIAMAAAAPTACRRAASNSAAPSQVLEDFTLRQTLRGAPVWKLRARAAVLHEEDNLAHLTGPTMEFYKQGKTVSRVTALGGRARLDTHDVLLSSSVVLDAPGEHAILETDSLAYSSKRNLFTTDAEVRMRRPGSRLRGRGIEAKPDLSEIRIFNQQSVVKEGGE